MESKEKLVPMFDYILIKPSVEEQTTKSGIILSVSKKERPQIGTVVEVGFGSLNEKGLRMPVILKKGQRVVYKKWGGEEIKVDGVELLLIEQKDVLAVYQ